MVSIVVVRELIGCYLVLTLTATGLAKLRNWRAISSDLHREGLVFTSFVPFVPAIIVMGAVTELLLAAFLAFGLDPVLAGSATAGLFGAFGIYWLFFLGKKDEKARCACAGVVRTDKRTSYTVAGAVLACLLQAALACGWTILKARSDEHGIDPFTCIALAAPIVVLFIGVLRQIKKTAPSSVTSSHMVPANAKDVSNGVTAKV